jgi:nucleotide-binding universal stress UspA family protein
MHAFKHILIATEFDAAGHRALDAASELAAELHANLTLLHVQVAHARADNALRPSAREAPTADTHRQLDAALALARKHGGYCEALIRRGSAAQVITEIATECGAGLIVVGTHQRQGLPEFVLGSVAAEVVRMSAVPVLVVPLQRPSGAGQ